MIVIIFIIVSYNRLFDCFEGGARRGKLGGSIYPHPRVRSTLLIFPPNPSTATFKRLLFRLYYTPCTYKYVYMVQQCKESSPIVRELTREIKRRRTTVKTTVVKPVAPVAQK